MFNECKKGVLTVGYAPQQPTATFSTNSILPLNQIYINTTRKDCFSPCDVERHGLHVNVGTGEITALKHTEIVLAGKIDTAVGAGVIVTIFGGSKAIPQSLVNGTEINAAFKLKKGDVLKLVVTGATSVVLTQTTDAQVPLILYTIAEV